jgi:hypothetical protein
MSTILPSERLCPAPGTPESGHHSRKVGLLGVVVPKAAETL